MVAHKQLDVWIFNSINFDLKKTTIPLYHLMRECVYVCVYVCVCVYVYVCACKFDNEIDGENVNTNTLTAKKPHKKTKKQKNPPSKK